MNHLKILERRHHHARVTSRQHAPRTRHIAALGLAANAPALAPPAGGAVKLSCRMQPARVDTIVRAAQPALAKDSASRSSSTTAWRQRRDRPAGAQPRGDGHTLSFVSNNVVIRRTC
jgi:hypothetical protein